MLKSVRFAAFLETKDAAAIYRLRYFDVKMIAHIIYIYIFGSNMATIPQELVNRTSHIFSHMAYVLIF